jgi:hypothetical protein
MLLIRRFYKKWHEPRHAKSGGTYVLVSAVL